MGFVHEVLALVLPGALFAALTHWVRFQLRRTEGYALLFYTLLAGWLIQQMVGILNGGLVAGMGALGLEPLLLTDGTYRAAMIGGALTFALVVARGVNRRYGVDRASRVVALSSGEFMELTFQLAVEKSSPVEVTLETGKSYVGVPVGSRMAAKDQGDLWLAPLMSGYRDEQRKLRITTYYVDELVGEPDALDDATQAKPGLSPADLMVTIPKSRIVSARPFDIELYEDRVAPRL